MCQLPPKLSRSHRQAASAVSPRADTRPPPPPPPPAALPSPAPHLPPRPTAARRSGNAPSEQTAAPWTHPGRGGLGKGGARGWATAKCSQCGQDAPRRARKLAAPAGSRCQQKVRPQSKLFRLSGLAAAALSACWVRDCARSACPPCLPAAPRRAACPPPTCGLNRRSAEMRPYTGMSSVFWAERKGGGGRAPQGGRGAAREVGCGSPAAEQRLPACGPAGAQIPLNQRPLRGHKVQWLPRQRPGWKARRQSKDTSSSRCCLCAPGGPRA